MPYALVQTSLDQKIDRHVLEEASVHVPSVARGDCARLARDLFGIVVGDLPLEEARAFQIALGHFGAQTEIVLQSKLPALMDPVRRRGIALKPDHFVAVDGLGREETFQWSEVQFAAGGLVNLVKYENRNFLEWNYSGGSTRRPAPNSVQLSQRPEEVKEAEFRLELFLSCPPYRLQFPAHKDSLLTVDDARLRFRQQEELLQLLHRVAKLFPARCLNLGMRAAQRGERFMYPSLPAFEEELLWHLFQSLRQG